MAKPSPAAIPPFVSHCLELLELLGAVRAKRMFGGWGLYADDVFIAIIGGDRLFLKTSAETRPHFAAAGCEPFVYDAKTGSIAMGYWSAPPDAMDSPALMAPWARRALQAALAARGARALKPRPGPGARRPAKPAPRKRLSGA